MKSIVIPALVGLTLCYSIGTTDAAVRGREYVETERKIVKLTKEMVIEEREVDVFGNLVEDLDATFAQGSTQLFWQVAKNLSASMKKELRQMRSNSTDTALALRIDRMQLIVRETDGLRESLQFNDPSVIARYRHLTGEFMSLLDEDLASRKRQIDSLRARQDG